MVTVDEFSCNGCGRTFEGATQELCFACLATRTRLSLKALGSRSGPMAFQLLGQHVPRARPNTGKRSSAIQVEAKAEVKAKDSKATKSRKPPKAEQARRGPVQPRSNERLFGEDARAARQKSRELPVLCGICGVPVGPADVAAHKLSEHGEKPGVAFKNRRPPRPGRQWVSVVSGGLPSLGKRN